MLRLVSAILLPCVMLLSANRLMCHEIRPSPAYARRNHRLMFVDAYLIFCRFLDYRVQSVYAILAIMLFLAVDKQVYISGLDVVHSIFLIECIGFVYLRKVVLGVGSGLIMDNHLDTFRCCISHYFVEVVVGICFYEVESCAVFHPVAVPSEIPSFYQNASDAVFCGEVDIFFSEFRISSVPRSIVPCIEVLVQNPPYTYIFGWTYPACIFDFVRFVEVEHNLGLLKSSRSVGHCDCSPRSMEWRFRINLNSILPRGELGFQTFVAQWNKVHLRVVEKCGFVDGVVFSVCAFDCEWSVSSVYLRERCLVSITLIIRIPAADPPCLMLLRE